MEKVIADEKPFYEISLRFFHPTIDPVEITILLNIEPNHIWESGEQAKTPSGGILNHVRNQSYWCYSTYTEGDSFPKEINEIALYLAPHRDFLHRFVSEKGRAEIYLCLPGSINIGGTIPSETLAKLIDLKVELSIEVFPHLKRQ